MDNPQPFAAPALTGLRVLDLTRNLAGPYCTMILGDLGADVVKIEHPAGGDDTRAWTPPAWNGESPTFLAANRNKRSLAVDLDHPDGRAVVRRLAEGADILVETFRPGSLAKRGLSYGELHSANPGLIYCSISAFGQDGPLRDSPGYDPVLQAYSGIMSMTGEPDRPPVRLGIGALDLGAGLWATLGILTAVMARREHGRGCRVDTSLYETSAWWLGYHLSAFLATGIAPMRQGTETAFIAPYEVFPTGAGDMFIAAPNDNLFRALAEVVGLPALADDPDYATNASRVTHRAELRALIVDRLATADAEEWERRLAARSVPCSRVRTVGDLAGDAQLAALGLLGAPTVPHPAVPDLRIVGDPVRIDEQRWEQRLPPPALGEHTDMVLRELGLAANEILALRKAGAVG
jgi:formyl-CoA transferase/CoA:oxalate CoA-transferase